MVDRFLVVSLCRTGRWCLKHLVRRNESWWRRRSSACSRLFKRCAAALYPWVRSWTTSRKIWTPCKTNCRLGARRAKKTHRLCNRSKGIIHLVKCDHTFSSMHPNIYPVFYLRHRITDNVVEPLKTELSELEQLIKDQQDKICAVKSNILKNEEKIQKMVSNISFSSQTWIQVHPEI